MCHYALQVWSGMRTGAWMLYGHSHGTLIDRGGKTMDVDMDCHDFAPAALTSIKKIMADRRNIVLEHDKICAR
tara:strand:+ start:971 stop:1189 length:219 start_codon:yes stop_codon:yes gene_type:complete